MAIRVKIRIESKKGKSIDVPALINSGYESERPEITISEELATKLDIFPELLPRTKITEYFTVAEEPLSVYFTPRALEVSVVTKDKIVGPVKTDLVILPRKSEVLLSDRLTDSLKIVLEKPGEGLWRFRDEKKIRKSL